MKSQPFDYSQKRWGITPIDNLITNFQGLEIDFFLQDIPKLKSKKLEIVDLGSGGGNIDAYLKNKYPNWKILGIDISGNVVNIARQNFPNVKFEVSPAHKIPKKDNSTDIVMGFDTFEHFEKLDSVIDEAKRVLKKKSYLYIAIPLEKQFPSIYWLLYSLGWRGKREFAGHVNFFNSREFVEYIENKGLKLIKKRYSNHFIFSIFDIIYFSSQHFSGKKASSFESGITEMDSGFNKGLMKFVKASISAITYFESKLLSWFPGGKGHFLFEYEK